MRIIGGQYRSRRLKGTPPPGTRPTSDRLRETLFNIMGDGVLESVFLDAYAGVGTVGLEAISRRASMVYFVEQSGEACEMIRRNLAELEVKSGYRVLNMVLDVAIKQFCESEIAFDIVFLDPPYHRDDLYERDLVSFDSKKLLTGNGVLIVEHSRKMRLPESVGKLQMVRTLKQGDSVLALYTAEEE